MTEERVSQNWPEGLKARVRKVVGSRGVTDFTIVAVLEKLTMIEVGENGTDDGAEVGQASQSATGAAPSSPQTETEAVSQGRAPLGEGDGSGSNPDDTPASVSDIPSVIELRQQLGMVTAAELPIPSTPRCDTCFSPLIDGECWNCDI